MKIRTQLIGAMVIAVAVAVALGAGIVMVTEQAQAGLDEQAESQQVARDISNMLALTNELTVYGGVRAASQWRTHYDQLRETLAMALQRRRPPPSELTALQRDIGGLQATFDALAQLPVTAATALEQRKRDLLVERLLSDTQAVVESRYRWASAIGRDQRRAQQRYTAMVLAAPAVLLALLLALGVLIGRRVLGPVARLRAAVMEIEAGRLDTRCASDARDELGDAKRAVDAMAETLQRRTAALAASESRLAQLADSLPAYVAHVDTEQRYTFVNAHFARDVDGDHRALVGKTLDQARSAGNHADLAPHIARVLSGEPVQFESERRMDGKPQTLRSTYVPDRDARGEVRGYYALTFDITDLRDAQRRQTEVERQLRAIADNLPGLISYFDRGERYRFLNAAFLEWMGIDPVANIGRTMAEVLTPELYAQRRPWMQRALGGERVSFALDSVMGQRLRHLQTVYVPDLQADGTVIGVYALSTDVTELVQAQRRLTQLAGSAPVPPPT